jgi:hypothetical protein
MTYGLAYGLCLIVVSSYPYAAPAVTSLTRDDVKYTTPEEHFVTLRRGEITAIIVGNHAIDNDELPGHRAGYNGVACLKHARRPENLFVGALAGLNFEHIHDGTLSVSQEKFAPRTAPMHLRKIDAQTIELYQPPTKPWMLESCGRFHLLEDGVIEYTFECIPRAEVFTQGYMGLFWASYIEEPEDGAINFIATTSGARDTGKLLHSVSPQHGVNATHPPAVQLPDIRIDPEFPLKLVTGRSPYVYTKPWYYGVSHGMAFVQMFRPDDHIWFAQSPSGGGGRNPAWDFQWFVPDVRVGRAYGFIMRAAYLPYRDHEQVARECRPHRKVLDPRESP